MSHILEHLHDDHSNMMRLLDLLDRHIEAIATGTEDDYALVSTIVRYFNHYPTSSHHPYEDVIFNWVSDERPDLADDVAQLRGEHVSQAELGRDVATFLQGVMAGHLVPRQKIVDELGEYSKVQRGHINKEEGHLLKETEKLLRERNLGEIPIPGREGVDPLFGEEIDSEYAELFEALES